MTQRHELRPDLRLIADQVWPGSRVLDLGCGDGELLSYLIGSQQCNGTGVERDPDGVLASVRRCVPLIELDIDTQLDEFADNSYDVVVLSRTLQAVLHPSVVLRQMARIGQRLIVTMPNFGYWKHRLALLSGHMPQSPDLPFTWYDTPNLHYSTLLDLEDFFKSVDLKIEKRIALDQNGRRMMRRPSPNLLASSALYVLDARGVSTPG